MNVRTTVEIDRETESVFADCEGWVSMHYGKLEVSDFVCDIDLTPDERDLAFEALIESARYNGGFSLPEMEPDAKRYYGQ